MNDSSTIAMTGNQKIVYVAKYLAVIWVVLSIAEAVVTYFCLNDPGSIEANPIGRALWLRSEPLFYGVKLLITMVVGCGFWLLSTRTKHLGVLVICEIFLVVMFAFILGNNLFQLLR